MDAPSTMGLLEAARHLFGLVLPGLMLGALAASLAKLLWWRALARVRWSALALPAMATSALVPMAALVLLGRDGRMAMYAAMVAVCALTLWWRGFGPGRR
jgi:hypothetical protein